MAFDPVTAALSFGTTVINKIFPDPEQRDKARIALAKMQQDGELNELQTRMSAIVAEAKSSDPWTSRARPSFLYVIYILILAAIPMGVLSAYSPSTALAVSAGMKSWLAAIPTELWTTFGVGYTGYTVARSAFDKRQIKL